MDIVEFVEKVCKVPLLEFQKEFLRKFDDSEEPDKQVICIQPRRIFSSSFGLSDTIVIADDLVGQECEIVKRRNK